LLTYKQGIIERTTSDLSSQSGAYDLLAAGTASEFSNHTTQLKLALQQARNNQPSPFLLKNERRYKSQAMPATFHPG